MLKKVVLWSNLFLAMSFSPLLPGQVGTAPGDPPVTTSAQPSMAVVPSSVPLAQSSDSLWTQPTLLGSWGGSRDLLVVYGFSFAPSYAGEVMGNLRGGAGGYDGQGRGVIYEHSLDLPVDLDLTKVFKGGPDAILHANALWIAGPGLSPSYTGDITNTSNIQGYNTVRLQELWYQQAFWGKRASIKIAEIAADTEFFTSSTAAVFVNGTFGEFTFLGSNLPDPYDPNAYPVASPGLRLAVQPTSFLYFQGGIFNGTAESQTANPNGTDLPVSSSSGALIFSELGYLVNQSTNEHGFQGTYKIGSFTHTHNFNSWASQKDVALRGGRLASEGADYGIYGVADQQLLSENGKSISAFTRVASGPPSTNVISWYADAGFNLTGFVPIRTNDVMGVAVARSIFSNAYSDYQVNTFGTNSYGAETVIETTYKYQVSPWWTIQPDFQYLFTPSGQAGSRDAIVAGLRTTVTF